jgi:thiosulfate/3-mercaptopyruvate sulfurtransferase
MDALVSTEWLAAELGAADLRVFDCTVFLHRPIDGPMEIESGRAAFEEGHIPNSGFLDLIDELSDPEARFPFTAPAPDALARALGGRGVGPGTRVVLYDRVVNMWATRAWWLLRSMGFDNAAVLDGGWRSWAAERRPISTEPEVGHAAVELEARPRPEMVVDMQAVEAGVADEDVCLINALTPQIHEGTDSPYGRAGHIPSSVNVHAVDLVCPDTHRFRPLEELRTRFARAGVVGPRFITWCGGGIAAASDAFVLTRLGHDDVAVYDGSLIEWVAAGRPLER